MLDTSISTHVVQIPVTLIVRNPKQPRQKFDEEELNQLTTSVKQHGVIQPLLVCPPNPNGIHMLIAGERRWRAAQNAKLETVPAVIRTVDASNLRILALVENVLRADMSPVEEGDAYIEMRKDGTSNAEIANAIGTNEARVAHCINCASLPDAARELIHAGALYTSSTFITPLKGIADIDPTACNELAKEIVKKQPGLKAAAKAANGVLAYLRNQLGKHTGKHPHRKSAPVLEVASYLAKVDVDDDQEPEGWNLLKQAERVPPWAALTQAAIEVCKTCELHDIASPQMCSACTAAQLLAKVTLLAPNPGKED